ncbi:hypothetical protein HN51_017627 [Arachis hypogaea]
MPRNREMAALTVSTVVQQKTRHDLLISTVIAIADGHFYLGIAVAISLSRSASSSGSPLRFGSSESLDRSPELHIAVMMKLMIEEAKKNKIERRGLNGDIF